MNHQDLRTALHRDADLAGEPSPHLLDQLARRRQHQRRQRAGVLAAVVVVLIGAGIPVVSSLVTRSHAAPATQTAIAPTPAVATDGAPTSSAVPPPMTSEAPQTQAASQIPTEPVGCIDVATARALYLASLPADASGTYGIDASIATACSGSWAWASSTHGGADGVVQTHGNVLYHLVGGRWKLWAAGPISASDCKVGVLPGKIHHLYCETN